MKVLKNITELVGTTPIIKLEGGLECVADIYAKLEFLNLTGSIKDRAALSMIKTAEAKGKIKPGDTIVEPTSGNTGIGLAALGSAMGYNVVIVMPDTMSAERITLMKAYGANVILTDGKKGMSGAIEKAEQIAKECGGFITGQFTNPANPKAHFETTGPEIWQDTDGKIDILVCGVGTGGTISGTGEFLKSKKSDIKIIGVEPASSPVLSGGEKGAHKIQGIGAGFVPETLNTAIYDEIIRVTDEDAYAQGKYLAKNCGLLVGISSGAAYKAALDIAKRPENKDKNIVVIFPDSGSRYLSTEGYY